MHNPFERPKVTPPNEERYENPVAKANEEFKARCTELLNQGLNFGGEGNRINRRVALNRFLDGLKKEHGRQAVFQLGLYQMVQGGGGGAGSWDLPNKEIESFLERFARGEES